MRVRMLAFVALACGACTKKNPAYCDVPSDCETGACDVPNHTCVDPVDGSMAPDADTRGPIVDTFQPADLVLGQASFDTEVLTCTQSSAWASGIAEANGVLYVRDRERVLGWAPVPTISNAPATLVLGKTTFDDCTEGGAVDAVHFGTSGMISAANGKVVMIDTLHNRALVWSSPPTANAQPANHVLGQPDFDTSVAGFGADQLRSPTGVWTDGTRLAIADQGNSRVLIWTTFPTSHGAPADLVIGQTAFGTGAPPTTASASNLSAPSGVWFDGTRFYVGDSGQNRVLIWNAFPSANGEPASVVVGQPDFTVRGSGLSAITMFSPHGVAVIDDALFVADLQNDRVLVFTPIPTTNGAAASFVLGQSALDVGANDPAPTSQTIARPRQLQVNDSHLWVTDEGHNRLLRYSLYPDQ
jgi:hypothetical protein